MSSSERPSYLNNNLPIYDPFYKILFIDCFVSKEYLNTLNTSLCINLKQRNPKDQLFRHGRAVWGSLASAGMGIDEILEFAKIKLICSQNWESIEDQDKYLASVSLLSVRTTLSVDYQVPYGSDLIARYMSTLFSISKDRTNWAFRYFSEPILAEGILLSLFN